MKVFGGSGLLLCGPKGNQIVGRQVWVIFVATISQPTATKDSAQKKAGFSSKLVLKKSAVPSIQASPTPEQVSEARRIKRKFPLSDEKSSKEDSSVPQETYATPKRQSRALSKITANRVRAIFLVLLLPVFVF